MNSLAARSAVSRALDAMPADGTLTLQVCTQCGSVQYPPRERCRSCLDDALDWRRIDGSATVLACSRLAQSLEAAFRSRLPWSIASCILDAGPVVFAHVEETLAQPGARLRIANAHDTHGAWCLVGVDPAATDAAAALSATLRSLKLDASDS